MAAEPCTDDEIEPTPVGVELTLTFRTRPHAVPLPGKRVGVGFVDDGGLIFWATFNGKTWRKAERLMEELPSWGGKVRGKIEKRRRNRIWLAGAGVQVFETALKPEEPQQAAE